MFYIVKKFEQVGGREDPIWGGLHRQTEWQTDITENRAHHFYLCCEGLFTRNEIQSIYQAEWVVDQFAPKFYSPIQNNIGPNFGDGLNSVTCDHLKKDGKFNDSIVICRQIS